MDGFIKQWGTNTVETYTLPIAYNTALQVVSSPNINTNDSMWYSNAYRINGTSLTTIIKKQTYSMNWETMGY